MRNLTIKEAVDLLIDGEIIAIPTETVYGLAADARNDVAVSQIFKAKGRPSDNPLIVHIGDVAQVDSLAINVSERARLLMDHFWPGPLTIILPSAGVVSELVTAKLSTVGLRMPAHDGALQLLRMSGLPLAAPSANISGKPSPTHAKHVAHDMEGRIAGVVDGGVCEVGLESTVIDMSLDVPVILRPGGISKEQIESVIGHIDVSESSSEQPKAPGMKYAHYAPDASVYIVKGQSRYFEKVILDFKEKKCKVGVLCLDTVREKYQLADVVKGIGEKGKNLYAALRQFDEQSVDVVLCEFFADVAVMNRLMKASEERVLSEVED
jgi:L-threonylcarbamoyladenylate synthase